MKIYKRITVGTWNNVKFHKYCNFNYLIRHTYTYYQLNITEEFQFVKLLHFPGKSIFLFPFSLNVTFTALRMPRKYHSIHLFLSLRWKRDGTTAFLSPVRKTKIAIECRLVAITTIQLLSFENISELRTKDVKRVTTVSRSQSHHPTVCFFYYLLNWN